MAKWKEVVGIIERMEDFITLNIQLFLYTPIDIEYFHWKLI